MDARELAARMRGQRLQLVDVRQPDEYAAGHIPGAVNIPSEELTCRISDLYRDDPIVFICQSGSRAGLACDAVAKERPDVFVLQGGLEAWKGAQMAVVRSAPSGISLMRQVHLIVGPVTLAASALVLAGFPGMAWLTAVFGLGLTIAGATGFCGLGAALAAMPWNKAKGSAK